jgi:hypothetical protein
LHVDQFCSAVGSRPYQIGFLEEVEVYYMLILHDGIFISQSAFVGIMQELLLPLSVAGVNFNKLRKWENPGASVTFLFFIYGLIYM